MCGVKVLSGVDTCLACKDNFYLHSVRRFLGRGSREEGVNKERGQEPRSEQTCGVKFNSCLF